MGIVFGVTGTEEPKYSLLKAGADYEIRSYQPYVVAQVDSSDSNSTFRVLAEYIGVFGEPKNQSRQAMAMTAPVITVPQKMEMTAPVFSDKETMSFVLPFEYQSISQCPVPTDKRIELKEIPARIVAVYPFSGWYSPDVGQQHFQTFYSELIAEQVIPDGTAPDAVQWSVA